MDIGSGKGWPSSALSNFAPHQFTIDGVECASMEGFLQSLKFNQPHIQLEVCKLTGLAAKRRGQKRNKAWKSTQTLWWLGQPMKRQGREFSDLLDRAFRELSTNTSFRKALLASNGAVLTHSIGKNSEKETVLTEREFCSRLMQIRREISQ